MMAKYSYPYHSGDGRFWPELDERTVGVATMAHYEGVNRCTINARAMAGWYGVPGRAAGVWLEKPAANPHSRGAWKFRPAMIWRLRRMGRYSDPEFHPRQITLPVFQCDPEKTAERMAASLAAPAAPVANPLDAFIGSIAAAVASHLQPLRIAGGADVIPFPRPAREG